MTTTRTFGAYGGRYVPETLIPALDELESAWSGLRDDESFRFHLVERLPLEVMGVLQTAAAGWLLVALAVGPMIGCALTFEAPGSRLEFAVVMATCAWPLAVFVWVQRRARAVVRGGD